MARLRIRSGVGRAAVLHRRAAAIAAASDAALRGHVPRPRSADEEQRLRALAGRLSAATARLAPGWLSLPFDEAPATAPAFAAPAEFVRVGTGRALPDAAFPVVVPLGHITFDADCRDPRVAGAVPALLLRLLATAPAGSLLARVVDPHGLVAGPFAALHDAGILPPPVADHSGLDAVLTEAEHWVRGRPKDRTLLVVVAGWPGGAGHAEATRLAALADASRGLHLLIAGWPPAGASRAVVSRPMPRTTRVALRHAYAVIDYPAGGPFATPPQPPPCLDQEVLLDPAPPAALVERVCAQLAGQALDEARITLGELLPAGPLWAGDATEGLSVTVGRAAGAPVTLRLAEPLRHWLIGGRPGSGRTTLLHSIVYGLASRYGPDQLAIEVLDPAGEGSFTAVAAAVPQVRTVGTGDRLPEVLRRLADGPAPAGPTRVVCVVDGWQALADEHLRTLRELAGSARRDVHLLLAGQGVPPPGVAEHCRARIALPGGRVLDPANDAAAALARGQAVVNTASGLGGPRGATRAHEQLVSFCDPYADPVALAGLRHRLSHQGGDQ